MKHFPDFMKNSKNLISSSQQNTDDIEGYYFQGADESQMAFWEAIQIAFHKNIHMILMNIWFVSVVNILHI